MYNTFLKLLFRKLLRSRLYSAISILSLAVGMTASILILTFVVYETNFDTMHPHHERIYRLNWGDAGTGARFATFFNPVTPILAEVLPELELFSRLATKEHLLTADGSEDGQGQFATVSLVDDGFFNIFDYATATGADPQTVIRDMQSAVLTEAAARKLFGDPNAVGKVFTVDGTYQFQVGAVVRNNPANSHLGSNIFVNIGNLPALWNEPEVWSNFGSDRMYHYVRLAPGATATAALQNARRFIADNMDPRMGDAFLMQPLRDIHFTTDLQNEMLMVDDVLGTFKPLRQRADIVIFSSVALLTLLIAALNFMNMQTVQFSKRARELGVRCVAGSSRPALVALLLGESMLIALLALLLSLPLCELFMPWFSSMLGLPLEAGAFLSAPNLLMLMGMAAGIGLASGLYPALTAARLSPVSALRGEIRKGRAAAQFRSMLIVFQFTISIGLIIGSFIVKSQIDYALSKPLGFDPANVVAVELPNNDARNAFATMKEQLLQLANVAAVAAGSTAPTRSLSDGAGLVRVGGDPENPLVTRTIAVSADYFETLGMNLLAGRTFSESFPGDRRPPVTADRPIASGGLILNETATRLAGWLTPEDAIGERFSQQNGVTGTNDLTVVGVVADAHFSSIRREVEPVSYVFNERYGPNVMLVKLSGGEQRAALSAIDLIWTRNVPGLPIQRVFLNDSYAALYAGEARTFALFIALSALAALIACSGLYGLASYITEHRTREIGVRKVMGGSVWSIVLLLTNDFSRLVLLSNLIAWPLAYVAMERWLENFAYRIDLTPVIFVGSGLIALCIAWVTVGGTAAKAARAKPVLALRYE